jgi:hypothetical protein
MAEHEDSGFDFDAALETVRWQKGAGRGKVCNGLSPPGQDSG